MKILVINWQDIRNPFGGGAEVQFHEVFSRVAQAGHDVVLYCSSFPGAPHEETLDGIKIIREGGRELFNYRVPGAYRKRFSREGFDVVVDDMNKIPFFTPLFVKEPIQGIIHHLFAESIFREVNPLVGAYVYFMERISLALYRKRKTPFIVVSPSTYQDLIDKGFDPSVLVQISLAVDHKLFRPTGVPKSPTPLIGYFGRLKKYKSVDHLLHALPIVLKEVPGVKVLIVGEGDDRPRLEALTRDLNLQDSVRFTGFVSDQEKVELLQQMWSKVATSSKEGWGLTVTEANACGTPAIASDVPGLRDAVQDGKTGLLYRYGDVPDLAVKITRLLKDENLRANLSKGALEWAALFSWEEAARRTIEVLEQRVALHHASSRRPA
jgi:glycosyltransferase involved in cell wall biosynthesis